jgi:hypothetical protein
MKTIIENAKDVPTSARDGHSGEAAPASEAAPAGEQGVLGRSLRKLSGVWRRDSPAR